VAVALYIALLPLLGFRISTALFVAGLQAVLERPQTPRQWAIQLAIAISTAAVTYLVFERYLSVILPHGSWSNW
jgi:putative tricarboxylic transport membrane protein